MDDVNVGISEVADRLWRISVPLPRSSWPTQSNVYAIQDGEGALHLVDAGWDSRQAWYTLSQGLERIGWQVEDVRSVTVTHLHRDHRGLADKIRDVSSAVVAMHERDNAAQYMSRAVREQELDAWGVPAAARGTLRRATPSEQPPTTVDRTLADRDLLEIPGRTTKIIHTPGHTTGSVCISLPGERLLFTGDHVLPDRFPGFGLGGPGCSEANDLHEYRRSLAQLSPLDGWLALPGHGNPIVDLPARIQEIVHHHASRSSEVRSVRASRPNATVWETAQSVPWGRGWDGLSPWHRVSALRQISMHHLATQVAT